MTLWFVSLTSIGFAQSITDCKFTIKASDQLINHSFGLFRYSISHVSKQKDADQISKLLNLRVGDNLYIQQDSLCTKFGAVLKYKSYYLKYVYVAVDSLNDRTYQSVNVKFEFAK